MKICFYAPVREREILSYNQFYAQDIRILHTLSNDVRLAIHWSEIPWNADLYFVWWWAWALLPLVKARALGKPTIVTGVMDLGNPMGGFTTRPIQHRMAIRASLALATANVFVSDLEYRAVPAALPTTRPYYAPLIVDSEEHSYRAGPREPFLLTVAWLSAYNPERKGVDLAIRAHAQLLQEEPNLELLIVGQEGDAAPRLRALVEQVGSRDRVRFLGRVDTPTKIDLLQRCAAYLQPSVFEGFGVAAAEAMACGAPVVACRTGTLPEVLGEYAFYASDRSTLAVAEATKRARREGTPEHTAAASARIGTRFAFEVRRKAIAQILSDLHVR